MAEAFFLILAEILQRLFPGELLQAGSVRTGQIVHVDFPYYLEQLPLLWRQAYPIAEPLFSAEINVAAITGKPHYVTDNTENPFHILDWQDLPIM
jgi:hypothetical protein